MRRDVLVPQFLAFHEFRVFCACDWLVNHSCQFAVVFSQRYAPFCQMEEEVFPIVHEFLAPWLLEHCGNLLAFLLNQMLAIYNDAFILYDYCFHGLTFSRNSSNRNSVSTGPGFASGWNWTLKKGFDLCLMPSLVPSFALMKNGSQFSSNDFVSTANPWFWVV